MIIHKIYIFIFFICQYNIYSDEYIETDDEKILLLRSINPINESMKKKPENKSLFSSIYSLIQSLIESITKTRENIVYEALILPKEKIILHIMFFIGFALFLKKYLKNIPIIKQKIYITDNINTIFQPIKPINLANFKKEIEDNSKLDESWKKLFLSLSSKINNEKIMYNEHIFNITLVNKEYMENLYNFCKRYQLELDHNLIYLEIMKNIINFMKLNCIIFWQIESYRSLCPNIINNNECAKIKKTIETKFPKIFDKFFENNLNKQTLKVETILNILNNHIYGKKTFKNIYKILLNEQQFFKDTDDNMETKIKSQSFTPDLSKLSDNQKEIIQTFNNCLNQINTDMEKRYTELNKFINPLLINEIKHKNFIKSLGYLFLCASL